MKKFYINRGGLILKRMIVVVICCTLAAGMPAGMNFVCATQSDAGSGNDNVSTVGTQADTANVDANGKLGKNSDVGIEVTKSITGTAGKKVEVAFALTSNNTETIKLKSVYPVIDNTFPFETSGDAYKVVGAGSEAEKQARLEAKFSMTARKDIEKGYHSVRFVGEYSKMTADGTTEDYYILKTINIYFTDAEATTGKKPNSNKKPTTESPDDGVDDGTDDGGGGSSGYSSGGSDDDEGTAPKLIITGYDSDPKKIMAGEAFKLTVHLQNTSKKVNVCNGKFMIGNEAGNFLPTSGSSAIFVESIPAGETGDLEIELKTSAELAQKNYILVVKGDFDDGKGNAFTYSDNLYVPVYQDVKMGITDVSLSPEAIGVGEEGSLMFTINNQSSVGVYNVTVQAKDDAVTGEESYVGNIAGSSSAYATLNLTGAKENGETGNINIVISYEDSEGNVGTIEQSVACLVSNDYEGLGLGGLDDFGDEDMEEDDSFYLSWPVIAAIVAAVIAIIVVVIILIRRKKKKAAALETDDFDDDLDDFDKEFGKGDNELIEVFKVDTGEDDMKHEDF
ncbi:MAG: hypothetical protein K2K56_12600 [Lachnospiraceae bacterium]|nr:hypothetical protein [Lachnospiraceae bacterium]